MGRRRDRSGRYAPGAGARDLRRAQPLHRPHALRRVPDVGNMAKASTGKNKAAGGKRGAPANRASMSYETIDVAVRNAVAIVVLNRPDVHNAFNETLISELTAAL